MKIHNWFAREDKPVEDDPTFDEDEAKAAADIPGDEVPSPEGNQSPPSDEPTPNIVDPVEPVGNIVAEPEPSTPGDSSVPEDPATVAEDAQTPPTVEPPSNIDPDPDATAAAAIAQATAHPTVSPPPAQIGQPMSDETRAWLEANGTRVWVVADPA